MAEHMLDMGQDTTLGKVEIAPEVIEVIAGIAAEVEGVAAMRGNFATDVVEKLGKKNHGKGVKVELANEDIIVDLYVVMYFGVAIPVVAQKIQDNIRQALFTMTGLEPKEVNVHIVGVTFETQNRNRTSVRMKRCLVT